MIRFGGRTADGGRLIGLALGQENLDRLRDGEPIQLDGATVGAPGVSVLIVAGPDAAEVVESLAEAAVRAGASVQEIREVAKAAGVPLPEEDTE